MSSFFSDVSRFHFLVLISWQFAIFLAAQQIYGIFANFRPLWRCGNATEASQNCRIFAECPVDDLEFIGSTFHSAAMEFDWICGEQAFVSSFFSQAQFAGVLVGAPVLGSAADRLGRKPVSLAAIALGIFSTSLNGVVPTWKTLLAARALLGFSVGGIMVVFFTYCVELLLPQHRLVMRGFFNWGWARLWMSLVCWTLPDWRHASFGCAAVALPAFFIVLFFFPESPTFLHNQGRTDEMMAAERYIARIGGVEYQPVVHRKIEHVKGLCELLKQHELRRRLAVLWLLWWTASVSSYATDLSSTSISGNLFLNQALFGLMLGISKILLVLADTTLPNFTRRQLHQGAQAGIILCFGCIALLKWINSKNVALLLLHLAGTVFIEYTWDALYLCAAESLETNCRAAGTGSCSLAARAGAILAPMIAFLGQIWSPAVYVTVVGVGIASLTVSCLFLIETKGVDLDEIQLDDTETSAKPLDSTSTI